MRTFVITYDDFGSICTGRFVGRDRADALRRFLLTRPNCRVLAVATAADYYRRLAS